MPLIDDVAARAPFRHLVTPGGQTMSVAMTNCGPVGWVSDRSGYRYSSRDPLTGQDWPRDAAASSCGWRSSAAARCGFPEFVPDACLINRYSAGARLTAHRDADEQNFAQPIVSVSLGLPASFAFYGLTRGGKGRTVALVDGDVLVWGGPSRLVVSRGAADQARHASADRRIPLQPHVPARTLSYVSLGRAAS